MRYFYYVVSEGTYIKSYLGEFEDKADLITDIINGSYDIVVYIEELTRSEWLKLKTKFEK